MRCPNCQEIRTEFAFEAANVHGSVKLSDDEFAVLHCPSCDILFPRIKPSETYHQTYYPLNYYNSNRVGNNFLGKLYGYIFAKDITKFISKIINHGNILDFGCGNGNFLASLPDTFVKYGIEINSAARKYIKKMYPQIIIYNDISSFSPKNKIDLITLWHVLEHLGDAKNTLLQINKTLKSKGILLIATPNTNSLGAKITGRHWFHLDAPRHLVLYNRNNLIKLLNNFGFKFIDTKVNVFEYPLDLFWSLFNNLKKESQILNLLLLIFIFPIALILKTAELFMPDKSETMTLTFKKV